MQNIIKRHRYCVSPETQEDSIPESRKNILLDGGCYGISYISPVHPDKFIDDVSRETKRQSKSQHALLRNIEAATCAGFCVDSIRQAKEIVSHDLNKALKEPYVLDNKNNHIPIETLPQRGGALLAQRYSNTTVSALVSACVKSFQYFTDKVCPLYDPPRIGLIGMPHFYYLLPPILRSRTVVIDPIAHQISDTPQFVSIDCSKIQDAMQDRQKLYNVLQDTLSSQEEHVRQQMEILQVSNDTTIEANHNKNINLTTSDEVLDQDVKPELMALRNMYGMFDIIIAECHECTLDAVENLCECIKAITRQRDNKNDELRRLSAVSTSGSIASISGEDTMGEMYIESGNFVSTLYDESAFIQNHPKIIMVAVSMLESKIYDLLNLSKCKLQPCIPGMVFSSLGMIDIYSNITDCPELSKRNDTDFPVRRWMKINRKQINTPVKSSKEEKQSSEIDIELDYSANICNVGNYDL